MPMCQGQRWALSRSLPALAGWLVLGCSGGHDRSVQSGQSAAPTTGTASAGSTAPAGNGSEATLTPATLTVADLDVYEKGAKARLDFLIQLKKDFDAAKTTQDSIRAATQMGSEKPDSDAARAAGVTLLHEQQVMRTLGDVISTLHVDEMSSFQLQVDTAHMDSAGLAQVRPLIAQDRQRRDSTKKAVMASMPPDVAAAFQQRRANLDSLTFQAMAAFAGGKKA